MAETEIHRLYVREIYRWFRKNWADEKDFVCYCQDGMPHAIQPMGINGFIPDFYAYSPLSGNVVIGEAKTISDLETKHSRLQLTAFFTYCASRKNSLFILAVPWTAICSAKSLVRQIKKNVASDNLTEHYLDSLPENLWET